MKKLFLGIYFVLLGLFAVWSYTLTDKNLIILQWQPYLDFQNWLWSLSVPAITYIYLFLISALIPLYLIMIHKKFLEEKSWLVSLFLLLTVFSYNSLSHDVFNYMFNAKMVLVYQTNPHIHSAIEFANDPWLRFMHNVHTPAPYFYGWTFLSLMPSMIGLGKFVTTWLAFKLWSGIGWLFLIWVQRKMVLRLKISENRWWEYVLNPLVIIEILIVSHNDAWMMALALLSLFLLIDSSKLTAKKILLSLIVLLISASMKYVTLILLPVWAIVVLKQVDKFPKKLSLGIPTSVLNFVSNNILDLAAVLLFLPLFSARSQWFHPWYLVWSLSFLPFIKMKWLRVILLSFSFSSLYRYIPWMWNGAFEYTPDIFTQQIWISWGLGLLIAFLWLGWSTSKMKLNSKS